VLVAAAGVLELSARHQEDGLVPALHEFCTREVPPKDRTNSARPPLSLVFRSIFASFLRDTLTLVDLMGSCLVYEGCPWMRFCVLFLAAASEFLRHRPPLMNQSQVVSFPALRFAGFNNKVLFSLPPL